MRMSSSRVVIAVAALLMTGASFAQEAAAPMLSDARIEIHDRADDQGTIRVRLVPEGGRPIVATINVLNNMSENEIAADIETALTVALGDAYRVNRGGGENINIRKADGDTPDFTLEISFNTPGLSITIQD